MHGVPGASSHHLVEFLTAVSRCGTPTDAARVAAELVAEEFDAEVGAVIIDDGVVAAVGFGRAPVPEPTLAALEPGSARVDLDGIGTCHAVSTRWNAGTTGRLVVARVEPAFEIGDRNLLLGMAASLGLALDMIDALDRERAQQRVLEVLLTIQRSIAHREPLPAVLAAITAGTATVLGGRPVSLVLDDAADPAHPIVTGADLTAAGPTTSATVHIHGDPVGALVVADDGLDADDEHLLQTFAEHASLALADARAAEAIEEAYRDPLTGLPNRQLFVDRLAQALACTESPAPSVLFIDLDRFKAVNDTLGHAAGDTLLRAAAARIRGCVDPETTTARFGGDEFAVLLTDSDDPTEAGTLAERIIARMRSPFTVDGRMFYIDATVGIAHAAGERTGVSPDELLGNADLAMHRAKASGGGTWLAYESQMRVALLDRLELHAHLQSALERHELDLHYQPIVNLETRQPVAVEALLRWNHPRRGPVPPLDFIPIAELTNTIIPIGRWVLETACVQLAEWRRRAPGLVLHVNVSAKQLRDRNFVDDVRYSLRLADVPAAALVIELTESVLIEEQEPVLASLNGLKALGVAIALDDFGTGFSSLAHLDRFPVDMLKIDRSFVSGVTGLMAGDQLIRTVLELGRGFDLAVVAEGIEDETQRERLVELGCRTGQGFLFAKPEHPDRLTGWFGSARITS